MKFRPLHDRVVVRRLEEDTKTAGGIIIPDTAKEKPMQGEVIAAGPGLRAENGKLVPLDVQERRPRICSANGLAPRSRSRAKSSPS